MILLRETVVREIYIFRVFVESAFWGDLRDSDVLIDLCVFMRSWDLFLER